MILFLAFRNLTRRRRRYVFMGLAVSVAFALITVVTGAAYGALESVKDKAARYFAGHISVTGFLPGLKQEITNPVEVMGVLEKSGLPIRTMARRTVYYRGDAQIFFGGETVKQRRLIGIDFSAEGREFEGLRFVEGGWEQLGHEAGRGIILSITAAKLLNCRVGDGVTLFVTTEAGQHNTADLTVVGIFEETSLFGYVSYIRMEDLNELMQKSPDFTTDIAIYLERGKNPNKAALTAATALSEKFTVAPLFDSREERDNALRKSIKVPTLVALTQDAQLAQIRQFLDALLGTTYFVLLVFMIIIMAGILNTYRVLVHERRREIGILRAMGITRAQVRKLFIAEAALLALGASGIGFIIGLGLLAALSMPDLSFLPGAGLLLENGRLRMELSLPIVSINIMLMIAAAVSAAWGPSRRAGRLQPAEAMRSS